MFCRWHPYIESTHFVDVGSYVLPLSVCRECAEEARECGLMIYERDHLEVPLMQQPTPGAPILELMLLGVSLG